MARANRRPSLWPLLAALTACDLTLPWTSTYVEPLWAHVDTTPISVSGRLDETDGPTLLIRVTSNAVNVMAGTEASELVEGAYRVEHREGGLDLYVRAARPGLVGEGVHTGELVVHVYGSRKASEMPGPLQGSPGRIPLTYTVKPASIADVTPSSIYLQQVAGGTPPSAVLELTGPSDAGPWTATFEGVATAWLELVPTTGATLPASVVATARYAGPERWQYGTVVIRRGASERRISAGLAYLDPAPTWSGETVGFDAVANQPTPPSPAVVQLGTETGAPCRVQSIVTRYEVWPGLGWLEGAATAAPGPLTISVTRTDLLPGTYGASLEVSCDSSLGPAAVVPVSLHVGAGDLSYPLEGVSFVVTTGTTPAEIARRIPLTAARPGVAFEARTEGGWLTVTPPSGVVDAIGTLTVSVNPAFLQTAPEYYQRGAVVVRHLEADGTPIERRIPADLWFTYRDVTGVMPGTVAAAPVGPVALSLDEWCSPGDVAMFGAIPAAETTCLAGGMLRATPPALAPGAHHVWVANGLGIERGDARLTVVAPATRQPIALASPGPIGRLVVDDARGVLWAVSPEAGRLQRWSASGGWAAAGVDLPGLHDALLRPDGAIIEALAGAAIAVVDPETLATSLPPTWSQLGPEGAAAWRWRMAAISNRLAIAVTSEIAGCAGNGCYAYCVWMDEPNLMNCGLDISGATVSSSDDGRVAVAARHGFPTDQALVRWVGGSPSTAPVTASASALALDRTGERILLLDEAAAAGATVARLLDGSLADVPGTLPGTTEAAILSQDGRTAFTFDAVARTVRVFDLTAALSGGAFAEVGSGIALAADPGAGVVLALAADERTLFVGGSASVVVVPLD